MLTVLAFWHFWCEILKHVGGKVDSNLVTAAVFSSQRPYRAMMTTCYTISKCFACLFIWENKVCLCVCIDLSLSFDLLKSLFSATSLSFHHLVLQKTSDDQQTHDLNVACCFSEASAVKVPFSEPPQLQIVSHFSLYWCFSAITVAFLPENNRELHLAFSHLIGVYTIKALERRRVNCKNVLEWKPIIRRSWMFLSCLRSDKPV